MKQAKSAKRPRKSRSYDNSLRVEKSQGNRQKIIENYVNLLVEKRGEEISFDELAEKSGVSTRTLFRFFGDKKSLSQELDIYLEQYISRAAQNLENMSVEAYAKFSYETFDKYENLILAYIYTSFGQTSRILFRKKFNTLVYNKIKSQIELTHTKEELRRVHFVITLINAKLWSDLRDIYGQTGSEMGESAKWAIRTLLKNLRV